MATVSLYRTWAEANVLPFSLLFILAGTLIPTAAQVASTVYVPATRVEYRSAGDGGGGGGVLPESEEPFQLCLTCRCCAANEPSVCLTMPCCFSIDCSLPDKPPVGSPARTLGGFDHGNKPVKRAKPGPSPL
ncbi:hypothetical protein AXF42_Ash020525 [Apostasia shenzhenica]|uniref:DUF7866 domain-containing protein n=1 Tax=Apostasia shenzhenica TaxID=1088818 RepID=A0A2I0BCT6_9ASPA|nr:hypothetical protein AXF42_Ash020525 [Apostasia shenzhenica]